MDTFLGILVVGVWIAISVVALKTAYSSRGQWSNCSPNRH
jgi:hypothetical protein